MHPGEQLCISELCIEAFCRSLSPPPAPSIPTCQLDDPNKCTPPHVSYTRVTREGQIKKSPLGRSGPGALPLRRWVFMTSPVTFYGSDTPFDPTDTQKPLKQMKARPFLSQNDVKTEAAQRPEGLNGAVSSLSASCERNPTTAET